MSKISAGTYYEPISPIGSSLDSIFDGIYSLDEQYTNDIEKIISELTNNEPGSHTDNKMNTEMQKRDVYYPLNQCYNSTAQPTRYFMQPQVVTSSIPETIQHPLQQAKTGVAFQGSASTPKKVNAYTVPPAMTSGSMDEAIQRLIIKTTHHTVEELHRKGILLCSRCYNSTCERL